MPCGAFPRSTDTSVEIIGRGNAEFVAATPLTTYAVYHGQDPEVILFPQLREKETLPLSPSLTRGLVVSHASLSFFAAGNLDIAQLYISLLEGDNHRFGTRPGIELAQD